MKQLQQQPPSLSPSRHSFVPFSTRLCCWCDALRGVCAQNLNIVWLVEPPKPNWESCTHTHTHTSVLVWVCVCLVYWWWKQLQPPPPTSRRAEQQLLLGSHIVVICTSPCIHLDHRQTLCHLSQPARTPVTLLCPLTWCALLRHLFKFKRCLWSSSVSVCKLPLCVCY